MNAEKKAQIQEQLKELGSFVKQILKARKSNISKFAERSRIPQSTLYALCVGKHEPKLQTLQLLAEDLSALTADTITVTQLTAFIPSLALEGATPLTVEQIAALQTSLGSLAGELATLEQAVATGTQAVANLHAHLRQVRRLLAGFEKSDMVKAIVALDSCRSEGKNGVEPSLPSPIVSLLLHVMNLAQRDRAAIAQEMELSPEQVDRLLDDGDAPIAEVEYGKIAALINRYCATQWTAAQLESLRGRWEFNRSQPAPVVDEDQNDSDSEDENDSDGDGVAFF